jgi:hypothetical protein
MRITFVLPSMCITGGNRVVFEYANRLKDKGHEINIVFPLVFLKSAPKYNLRYFFALLLQTAENLKLKYHRGWFDVRAALYMLPTGNPWFTKIVQRFIPDADIIVATSWETTYFVEQLSASKGKKFYFIQNYEIWDVWNDEESWRKAESIEKDATRLCLAMKDIIPEQDSLKKAKEMVDCTYKMPFRKITISSWLKELLEKRFDEPVEGMVINGVNFETFNREEENHNGNDRNGTINILMPYRLIRWKGIADGLAAFKIAKEKHPEANFSVYGYVRDGDVPEWVSFYQTPSDDELRKIYNRSDIFVLPSWVEGCQLPPMEAMACGCAVVATDVGGIPDYAIDGETILTAPLKSPEALAGHIIRLIENPQERKRIARNGHDHIRQFTWENATNRMESIFSTALAAGQDQNKTESG